MMSQHGLDDNIVLFLQMASRGRNEKKNLVKIESYFMDGRNISWVGLSQLEQYVFLSAILHV